MTVTQYTDAVEIDGSQDVPQLTVQGHSIQSNDLQTWEDSAGSDLAHLTGSGQLQVGDTPGMGVPDALLQIRRDGTATTSPKRGLHVSGEVADTTDTQLTGSEHQVTLSGVATTTQTATALATALTTDGADVGTAMAMDVVIDQSGGATVPTAIGVDIQDVEDATSNKALQTGKGLVHLGDTLQMLEQLASPTGVADTYHAFPKSGRFYGVNGADEETDLSHTVFKDSYANRPTTAIATGDLFIPDDGYGVQRYNGTDWDTWGGLHKFVAPDLNDFIWVNQGTASATQEGESIYLHGPLVSGADVRMLLIDTPSTPFTITAYLIPLLWHMNYNTAGLVWRESSSGKLIKNGYRANTGRKSFSIHSQRYNSPTSYNGTEFIADMPGFVPWIRLEDDGTHRKLYLSLNGVNWILVHSISRTYFITADQVGIHLIPRGSSADGDDCGLHLLSWEVSS